MISLSFFIERVDPVPHPPTEGRFVHDKTGLPRHLLGRTGVRSVTRILDVTDETDARGADRILDFSTAATGSTFFASTRGFLESLGD
ncbi:hypothetical protein SAMN04515680_2048 [Leifsonia sp. 21MFCrub1.1]|nr:hypothetical protein SAMN04515680_2048 [Leifsonia sp. 21MFCrub1.1]